MMQISVINCGIIKNLSFVNERVNNFNEKYFIYLGEWV